MGGLEFGAEAVVFGFVEGDVGVFEFGFLRSGEFAGDKVWRKEAFPTLRKPGFRGILMYFTTDACGRSVVNSWRQNQSGSN